jgi:adenylylsulfate kinase-like enzyme
VKIRKVIIWFTGIPGSGKTALSIKLYNFLKIKNKKVKLLDGDIFRKKIKNFKYDLISREKVGQIKMSMANNYYDKGYIVIVSGVAHKKKWRKDLRKLANSRNYQEFYLKSSISKCLKRKQHLKNYHRLFKSNYEEYSNFDLKINTEEKIKNSFAKIKIYLLSKYYDK